jgi:hypothetical protein
MNKGEATAQRRDDTLAGQLARAGVKRRPKSAQKAGAGIIGNHAAISIPAPLAGDGRPRNAFGVLTGFGQAYADYYAKRDRMAARPGL